MTAPAVFAGEPFLEDLGGLHRTGFVVCAFFSAGDGYERYAQRLAASCRRFDLPHSIWRAPTVHCSISLRGSPDLRFTKPSFIGFCLDRFPGADVAYLDVDTLFMAPPQAFFEARAAGCDFAIYNWLADAHNETYLPANMKIRPTEGNFVFYLFRHRIDWTSDKQLICSGVTQLWADTAAARGLLCRWQTTITDNPRTADDKCLNFAFNNPPPDTVPIRPLWLDKAYARSPWWPHVCPVVLHPEIPALDQPFAPIRETATCRAVHQKHCIKNEGPTVFPRDGGVEVSTGTTFRVDSQSRPEPVGRYDGQFWIFPEDM